MINNDDFVRAVAEVNVPLAFGVDYLRNGDITPAKSPRHVKMRVLGALMPQLRFPKCPLCKSEFHYKHVDLELPFRCPVCDQWLRVTHSYWYTASGIFGSLIMSGLICYEVGARGAYLALYAPFGAVPIFFGVVFWRIHFAPPRLRASNPPGTSVLGLNR